MHNYEDKKDVHIICEECTGGDLFDRILREKTVGEPAAAKAIHAIVSLVQHCHSMNVVHRCFCMGENGRGGTGQTVL